MNATLTTWSRDQLQVFQDGLSIPRHLQAWCKEQLREFIHWGFPKSRDEHWKYTSLSPLFEKKFVVQSSNHPVQVDCSAYYLPDSYRLVFINGIFSQAHSYVSDLPKEVLLSRTWDLDKIDIFLHQEMNGFSDHKALSQFHWLNGALLSDGLFLTLPEKTELKKPVHLLYLMTENDQSLMCHPRHLIQLGKDSRATLIEEYVGAGDQSYFNNVVSQLSLKSGAYLNYYKLQRENVASINIANTFVEQEADSFFKAFHIALGGKLNREDLNISLNGPRAECELFGFYFPQSGQHIDFHTRIDHRYNHTRSCQYYKGIIDGDGHAVFNGKIMAHAEARHVQAEQKNHNLLLSKKAGVDTKPELEVYTNEIQCSHGATVGDLDEDALFYLRSRGISAELARQLLMNGFAGEILDRIPDTQITAYINKGINLYA